MERPHLNPNAITKIADSAAGGAIALVAGVTIADVSDVVTIFAGIVAMIAGLAAAWFHIEGAIQKRRIRKKKNR